MPPRDDQRHQRAYALFVSLGAKRTLKKVAAELGVSVSTIKAWARHENWKGRLAEQESQQARQVIDRNLHDGAQETSRNIRLVQMALLSLAKNIREGKVTGVMSDIDRLIRLEEYLTSRGNKGRNRILPEHWGAVECRKFLVDVTISTYLRQPENRERIKAAIADIDAGREPDWERAPADAAERRGLTAPGPLSKGTVFGGKGTEKDRFAAGPPNSP